jgi:hypothetical protein
MRPGSEGHQREQEVDMLFGCGRVLELLPAGIGRLN